MNRSLLIVFLVTALSFDMSVYSQELINWADPSELDIDNNSNFKILGVVGDKYYAISERNRNRSLYTFTLDHKLLNKEDFNVFGKSREYSIQNIVTTPRDTFLYIHELSQQHKEWVLYKCEYDNGQFTKPVEIYFEKYNDISNKRLRETYRQYEIFSNSGGGMVISPDSSHLAFVNVIVTTESRQSEVVSVIVFDSAMNEKWRASFDYDFSDRNIEIKAIRLANNGIPYMLAELESDIEYGKGIVPLRVKNLPRNKYFVYRVDQSGILRQEVKIEEETGIVDANMIFPDRDSDDYVIAGYYSSGEKNNRVSGLFWCKGNPELEITGFKTTPLEKNVIKDMSYDFIVNDMLRMNNGAVGFVSEDYRINVNNNNFNNGAFGSFNRVGGVTYTYYSGDIVISHFDNQGNVVKTNYIQRRFETGDNTFSNYALTESDNAYHIFYNTTKSRKEAKGLGLKGRIFTDVLSISRSGSIQLMSTLISERDDNFLFSPNLMIHNNKRAIMGGYDGRELILAEIPLD